MQAMRKQRKIALGSNGQHCDLVAAARDDDRRLSAVARDAAVASELSATVALVGAARCTDSSTRRSGALLPTISYFASIASFS